MSEQNFDSKLDTVVALIDAGKFEYAYSSGGFTTEDGYVGIAFDNGTLAVFYWGLHVTHKLFSTQGVRVVERVHLSREKVPEPVEGQEFYCPYRPTVDIYISRSAMTDIDKKLLDGRIETLMQGAADHARSKAVESLDYLLDGLTV